MLKEKSLAGSGREYYVPTPKFRISTDSEDGRWKVHIPTQEARVESNRVVVVFDEEELREIIEAINLALAG
jgi:hypothetical protein